MSDHQEQNSSDDNEDPRDEEITFSPDDVPESREYKIRANVDETEDSEDSN